MLWRVKKRWQRWRYRDLYAAIEAKRWVEVERAGLRWRLNMANVVDQAVALQGAFEPETTRLARQFIKPGMHVMDVGANLGYFTLLFAQQVGAAGKVWAFEPVDSYREQLHWHVAHNQFTDRVQIFPYGLSSQAEQLTIGIDAAGATLHWVAANTPTGSQTIQLQRLDDVVSELKPESLHFVKVDIDGHEPAFVQGGCNTLKTFQPVMVVEFANLNLDKAGYNVTMLKDQLQALGYVLFSEKTHQPFKDRPAFLVECGNYLFSANVWAIPQSRLTGSAATLDEVAWDYRP